MKVIIAEKYNVAKDIAKVAENDAKLINVQGGRSYFKGKRYIVAYLQGHIFNFKLPSEIDDRLKNWREDIFPLKLPDPLPLKVDESKKDHFITIQHIVSNEKFDEFIVATDGDREGQGIWERVYSELNNFPQDVPITRMWINECTLEGLNKALNERIPNSEKKNLKDAAYLRALDDYLIGMNGSGICTCKFGGYQNVVNIGRVQTAVAKIIEQRELEIINFIPKDYVILTMDITSDEPNQFINLRHKPRNKEKLSLEKADEIMQQIKHSNVVRVSVTNKKSISKPYSLFDALDVQKEMNKQYGYSANETANILQSLYNEKKLITYPGTKAHQLSVSAAKIALYPLVQLRHMGIYDDYIEKIFLNNWEIASHCVTDKGLAHEAITPVFGSIEKENIDSLSIKERNVYKAIVKRYIQAFFPDAQFDVTKIRTNAGGELFETEGKILVEEGYLEVVGKRADKLIPRITDNQCYNIHKLDKTSKKTTPPPRYNGNTILDAMKYAGRFIEEQKYADILADEDIEGIGTSRTRGAILDKMQEHNYFYVEKNEIIPTKKLMDLMKVLPDNITITTPLATAKMMEALNAVEEGHLPASEYKQMIIDEVNEMVETIKSQDRKYVGQAELGVCPECGSPLRKMKGKYGEFIGCSNFDCSYIQKKEKKQVETTNEVCPKCGKKLVKRIGKYGPFLACEDYQNCRYIKPKEKKNELTGEKCPQCGSDMVYKVGKNGKFEACSNYPSCKYIKSSEKKSKSEPQTTNQVCPNCGKPLIERNGKFGKFLSCTGYPACDYTMNLNKANNSTKSKNKQYNKTNKKEPEKTGRSCPECRTGELVIRTGTYGKFISCSNYPKCKYTEKIG